MNRKIRKNVFETNSSSTHSICVTKNNILDSKVDYVAFGIGEFGWECDTLTTLYSKASYLYTAILTNDNREDLLNKVKKILDENKISYDFEEPQFHSWEYNNIEHISLDNGYIDHSNELDDFLEICKDEDKLMKFLFSSQSFVVTGNDNDDRDVDINVNYDHEEYYKGN